MYRGDDHDAGRKSQRKDIFTDLLLWDTVRGPDSTGIALIPRYNAEKPAEVYKRAITAADFLQMRPAGLLIDRMNAPAAVIGHNRFATKGYLDHVSAHPHQVDHITLVHNGTLTNYRSLAKESPAEMDSAYIAAGMATNGEKETLEKLEGSFALAWHNAKDKTLNFARNKERPLVWVYDDYDTLWYGSEWSMLFAALDRRGRKFTSKFQEARPNTWYKFPMNSTREYTSVPFVFAPPKAAAIACAAPAAGGTGPAGGGRTTKAERKAEARLQNTGHRYNQIVVLRHLKWLPYKKNKGNLGQMSGVCGPSPGTELVVHGVTLKMWRVYSTFAGPIYVRLKNATKIGTLTTLYGEVEEGFTVRPVVQGPHGKITHEEFLTLTKGGCQNCGTSLSPSDADTITWYGDVPSAVCGACSEKLTNPRRGLH